MSSTLYCSISIKLEFRDRFSRNTQISNFMEIRQVRTGSWTDMTELGVAFCSFFRTPLRIMAWFWGLLLVQIALVFTVFLSWHEGSMCPFTV